MSVKRILENKPVSVTEGVKKLTQKKTYTDDELKKLLAGPRKYTEEEQKIVDSLPHAAVERYKNPYGYIKNHAEQSFIKNVSYNDAAKVFDGNDMMVGGRTYSEHLKNYYDRMNRKQNLISASGKDYGPMRYGVIDRLANFSLSDDFTFESESERDAVNRFRKEEKVELKLGDKTIKINYGEYNAFVNDKLDAYPENNQSEELKYLKSYPMYPLTTTDRNGNEKNWGLISYNGMKAIQDGKTYNSEFADERNTIESYNDARPKSYKEMKEKFDYFTLEYAKALPANMDKNPDMTPDSEYLNAMTPLERDKIYKKYGEELAYSIQTGEERAEFTSMIEHHRTELDRIRNRAYIDGDKETGEYLDERLKELKTLKALGSDWYDSKDEREREAELETKAHEIGAKYINLADESGVSGEYKPQTNIEDIVNLKKLTSAQKYDAINQYKSGGLDNCLFVNGDFPSDMLWAYLEDEEIEIYNKCYAISPETAEKYLDELEPVLKMRKSKSKTEKAYNYGKEHPILGGLGAVGKNIVGAPIAVIDNFFDAFSGEVDTYDDSSVFLRESQAMRAGGAQYMQDNFGELGAFAYNTGLSILENAVVILATKGIGSAAGLGTKAISGIASGTMAMNAASNQMISIADRGGNTAQILLGGLAAGGAEYIFEKFSVESLLKPSSGRLVADIFKQSGVEASEEMFTEVANIISDTVIMGQNSESELMRQKLVLDGYSAEEATKAVFFQNLDQVLMAGASGAVSGGVMSGGKALGASVADIYGYKNYSKKIDAVAETVRGDAAKLDAVIRLGNDIGNGEARYIAELMQEGIKPDAKQVRTLVESVAKSSIAKDATLPNVVRTIAAIEGRDADYYNSQEAIDTARAVLRMVSGTATKADYALIERSEGARTVVLSAEGTKAWDSLKAEADRRMRSETPAKSDVKYRYAGKTKSGIKKYVTDFPADMDTKTREKVFKERIASIFNLGAVKLNTDTKKIQVMGDDLTSQKNLYGDKKSTNEERNAKINSLYDIAEILSDSEYVGKEIEPSFKDSTVKPKNQAHKDVKYWYKFKNTISMDGVIYDVTFSIRDKGKSQYQYLIDFHKKGDNSNQPYGSKSLRRAIDELSPENSISKDKATVNSKDMRDGEIYSQGKRVSFEKGERVGGNVVYNEESRRFAKKNREGYKVIQTMAKDLKMKVKFVKGLVDGDGNVLDGVITSEGIFINTQSENPTRFAATHEFSHRMKQTGGKAWQRYQDYVIKHLKETGQYQAKYDAKKGFYAENEIDEEIAADYIGELFSDVKELSDFIRESRGLAFSVRNMWYKVLDKLGLSDEKKKAQRMWASAYREAMKNSDVKYEEDRLSKAETRKIFKEQVIDAIHNPNKIDGNNVLVGYTTSILKQLGLNDHLMFMTKGHVRDINTPEDGIHSEYHGLSEGEIYDILPYALEYPAIVFDSISKDNPNAVCILSEKTTKNGLPILIAIKPDGNGQYNNVRIESNFILSSYGKNNSMGYLNALANNSERVLFIDEIRTKKLLEVISEINKRTQKSFKGARLQLPARLNNLRFNHILHKSENVVKRKDEENIGIMRLEERIKGDELLNALDTIKEIRDIGGRVDKFGYVTLFHATSKENARSIAENKEMSAKEDGLFFSTKADGEIKGYGKSILKFKIPVEMLVMDDMFDNEIHFRLPLENKNKVMDVSEYLVDSPSVKGKKSVAGTRVVEGTTSSTASGPPSPQGEGSGGSSEKAKYTDRFSREKLKSRIDSDFTYLHGMLKDPTDKRHIPEHLRAEVAAVLDCIKFETKQLDKIRDAGKEAQSPTAIKLAGISGLYEDIIRKAWGVEKSGESKLFDEYLSSDLLELKESIPVDESGEFKRLQDMSTEELRVIGDVLRGIHHAVTKSNQAFTEGIKTTIDEASGNVVAELATTRSERKGSGQKLEYGKEKGIGKAIGAIDKFMNVDMLQPWDMFHKIGGTLEQIFGENRKAFDRHIINLRKASDAIKAAIGDLKVKKMTGKGAEVSKFELSDGSEITVDKGQLLSLYALYKRPQGKEHILSGGIVTGRKATDGSGNKISGNEIHKVRENDLGEMFETLSKEEKKMVEDIVRFMSKECAAWGNEASMKLYGYEKYGEGWYFPIKVADTTLQMWSGSENEGNLRTQSFTKRLVKNAGNAVVINDFFDTVTGHINGMSLYNTIALPMLDMERVLNHKSDGETVRQAIDITYGKAVNRYINKWLEDVNGSRKITDDGGLTEKFFKNAKKASIGMNMRVLFQQPTSITRALLFMNPIDLTAGAKALGNPKKTIKEMQKHVPIAYWKSLGFRDVGVGSSLKDAIIDIESRYDKVAMGGYGLADDVTWALIYTAVKTEVQRKNPDIEVGSDAYWEKVVDRFNYIVDRSQVVDSVFHRSQIMRNERDFVKSATMFMSEPIKQLNMYRTELEDAVKNKTKLRKIGRATAVYMFSNLILALAQALPDAWREDDEKELYEEGGKRLSYWDIYRKKFGEDFGDDMNPLNGIPYVKDLISILNGYSMDRVEYSALVRTINAVKALNNDKIPLPTRMWNVFKSGAPIFGVAPGNLARDVEGITKSIMRGFGDEYTDYTLTKMNWDVKNPANKSKFMKHYERAIGNGNAEEAQLILGDYLESVFKGKEFSSEHSKEVLEEVTKLYGKTKSDSKLLFGIPDESFSHEGKKTVIPEDKYDEYVEGYYDILWQTAYDFVKSEEYKSLSDEDKVRSFGELKTYAEDAQRMESIEGYELSGWKNDVYSGETGFIDSVIKRKENREYQAEREEYKDTFNYDESKYTPDELGVLEQVEEDAASYYSSIEMGREYSSQLRHVQVYDDYISDEMEIEEYAGVRAYAKKTAAMSDGKESMTKNELKIYLDSTDYSREMKAALFEAIGNKGWKNPYTGGKIGDGVHYPVIED